MDQPVGPSELDEETRLALAAAAGDPQAFGALIGACYDRTYRLAWRFLGQREAAEDVAQGVCVKLAEAIRSFRGEAAFGTWLYRLTYNAAIDRLRQDQRLRTLEPSTLMRLADDVLEPAPSAEERVVGAELWQAVRGLPAQQRDAVLLVYAEDMSHAQAAAVMGVAENTVSWHLHAARKRLKALLDSQD